METCKTSFVKFIKLLDEDSSSFLTISKKKLGVAIEAFKNRKCITVKGPNGVYEIGISISREAVTLDKGWAAFYRAHNLCQTDKLKFNFGCNGLFQIQIYDKNGELVGPSVTKIELQYSKKRRFFINLKQLFQGGVKRKHECKTNIEGRSHDKKGKAVASSSRFPGKEKEGRSHDKKRKAVASSSRFPGKEKEGRSHDKKRKAVASSSRFPGKEKDRVYIQIIESDTSDSSENEGRSDRQVKVQLRKAFVSRRRPVTDVEKKMALEAAEGFQSSRPYFLKEMKTPNVYKEFKFVVPVEFARANLPAKKTDIILRVPGGIDKWKVSCLYHVYPGKQTVWQISGGWSQFSFANNLEAGDVCVFELMSRPEKQKKKMNVHIFRVVQEIAPLRVR